MQFEIDKHYNRKTSLKHLEAFEPVKVQLTHFTNKDENVPYSVMTIDTGACHLHIRITPTEARDLATNLKAHAEEFEAHLAQHARDEVAA